MFALGWYNFCRPCMTLKTPATVAALPALARIKNPVEQHKLLIVAMAEQCRDLITTSEEPHSKLPQAIRPKRRSQEGFRVRRDIAGRH
jgi:hypothetical protein